MADNWMDLDKEESDTLRRAPGEGAGNKPATGLDKAKGALKETVSWAVIIAVAVALSLFITKFVIFKAVVPTGSMQNTIMIDDKLVGWQLFTKVNRGDIMIFPNPDYDPQKNGDDKYLVKRVIGMPGETLEIHDGAVYINNKKLNEPYLKEDVISGTFGPYEIPDGKYFMMGDNRNSSLDARFWTNKYISKKDMTAKVIFKYSPKFEWFKKVKYNY